MIGNLKGFDPELAVAPGTMPELERWVLHRLAAVDRKVRNGYSRYEFQSVFQTVFTFATVDLSSFYFDIRKDVLYCDRANGPDRLAALTVLDILFHRLTTWLAPVLAFTMEEVWPRVPRRGKFLRFRFSGNRHRMRTMRCSRLVRSCGLPAGRYPRTEIERQKRSSVQASRAAPIVHSPMASLSLLAHVQSPDDVCITPAFSLDRAGTGRRAAAPGGQPRVLCSFRPADGEKCARCWKILPEVGSGNRRDLCRRCESVLDAGS